MGRKDEGSKGIEGLTRQGQGNGPLKRTLRPQMFHHPPVEIFEQFGPKLFLGNTQSFLRKSGLGESRGFFDKNAGWFVRKAPRYVVTAGPVIGDVVAIKPNG